MVTSKLDDKAIFNAARLIDSPDDRRAHLQMACGDDIEQRDRVAALLFTLDQGKPFLESPAISLHPIVDIALTLKAPKEIGPYRIREQIGEGGMGVVYLAQQTEPVRRKVALKIIKPGMDSKHVIARFEAERQALAMMNHSNIARIFDAGMTAEGRPYFVMELVRGLPIDEYCDEAVLSLSDRLHLFIDVCRAIQHAHQKGILHRDLKPSNVLVTEHDGVPVVKVIDFGIAKALEHDLTQRTLFTHSSELIGTPVYMSPEQAGKGSLDVDTRSDVYSLGVLLYKLLSGVTPFDQETLNGASPDEIRRIIREDDPLRPSRRVSTLNNELVSTISERRGTDIRELSLSMQRELDWVVMKTLEKDRSRRYQSASGLAADLQRYLDGDVVEACPPSASYRLRKFARRNKATFTITLAVAISLLIGIIGTTWQSIRATQETTRAVAAQELAEKNLAAALDAVDKLLEHASDPDLAEIPKVQPIRKKIMEDALEFYEQFLLTNGDSPQLRYRAARTRISLGSLANGMGQRDLARKSFEDALKHLEELKARFPNETSYRQKLAHLHSKLGWFWKQDSPQKFEWAIRHFQAAKDEYDSLTKLHPEYSTNYQNSSENALLEIAGTFGKSGDQDRFHELTLAAYEASIHADNPLGNFNTKVYAAMQLAGILESTDPARAESLYLEALERSRHRYQTDGLRQFRMLYVYNLNKAGDFLTKRNHKDAVDLALEAVEMTVELASEFPSIRRYQEELGPALGSYFSRLPKGTSGAELARLLQEYGDQIPNHIEVLHEAHASRLASEDDSISTLSIAIEQYTGTSAYFRYRGGVYSDRDEFELALADLNRAVAAAEDAVYYLLYQAALLSVATEDPARHSELCLKMLTTFADSDLPSETHFAAWACALAPDAIEDYAPAIKLARHAVDKDPEKSQYLNALGAILMRSGQYEQAKVKLEKAIAASDSANTSPGYARYFLAMTEHHLGHQQAAAEQLSAANKIAEAELAESPIWNRKLTLELLRAEAETLVGRGEIEAAVNRSVEQLSQLLRGDRACGSLNNWDNCSTFAK